MRDADSDWCVYILRCADGTLYTGITNRLAARIELHGSGRGAKYTRSRRPVELLWHRPMPDRSAALRAELRVKSWRRRRKLDLVAGRCDL